VTPFASALACVVDLIGPWDTMDDGVARWGRRGGISLAVHRHGDDIVLTAERLDGDARVWATVGGHTARAACAWLGWSVPRPPAVGFDANGSLVRDDADGAPRSTTRGALGEGDW
jgi:hypothetical protein